MVAFELLVAPAEALRLGTDSPTSPRAQAVAPSRRPHSVPPAAGLVLVLLVEKQVSKKIAVGCGPRAGLGGRLGGRNGGSRLVEGRRVQSSLEPTLDEVDVRLCREALAELELER